MENASKALLIAGAILIVILLISLGIYIYSQAQQTINSVNMDEQQITAFNNKFAQYEGDSRSGSEVNALINQVISSNQAATAEGAEEKYITINYPLPTGNVAVNQTSTKATKVDSGGSYKVKFTYTNGLITKIDITKNP